MKTKKLSLPAASFNPLQRGAEALAQVCDFFRARRFVREIKWLGFLPTKTEMILQAMLRQPNLELKNKLESLLELKGDLLERRLSPFQIERKMNFHRAVFFGRVENALANGMEN